MENIARTHEDIESHIRDLQAKKKELNAEAAKDKGVGLADRGYFDIDLYDGGDTNSKYEGYVTSIAPNDDIDDEEDEGLPIGRNNRPMGYTAPAALLNEMGQGEDYDPFAERRKPTVAEKEDEYRQKRRRLVISPERVDPFADGGKTPDVGSRSYTEIMREQMLKGEEAELRKKIQEKAKDGSLKINSTAQAAKPAPVEAKKRGRWDQAVDEQFVAPKKLAVPATPSWDAEKTPADHRWDETPGHKGSETPGATPNVRIWDATPAHVSGAATTPGRETPAEKSTRRNRWDETPKTERETPGHSWAETPRADRVSGDGVLLEGTTPASKRRSRWDETPSNATPSAMTPSIAMTPTPHGTTTPGHATPLLTPGGTTPIGHKAMAMATPTPGHLASMTPEQLQAYRWEKEIDERNRPFTDEELDVMFPPGYKILPPPAGYIPIRTPARKLTATPTPIAGTPAAFFIQTEDKSAKFVDNQPKGNLPFMKPEDAQYFDKLLVEVDEDALSPEEQKERKIMKLLLKIKNGTPPMRKAALRQITDKSREFGAGPLFNQILPLLMSPTLEDQERHLLVKVIDRILYKLDDLVRPYVHKILVVIEPLLIDEDYYARVEGREIISNLAKAAGLATMISTMRPDIDNIDEYVRNTTARAFAVVASALGIPSLLPFLKAVCKSKKSWQARHTGIKIVQQIAILMGCAILPHLKSLVEIIEHGLVDEQQKVRTITALALAALAEAATPYGIESFDSVLKPLWKGIRTHRGKGLAAFLKAIGYLIPLMDAEYANYYTREVMLILIREFQSPDEEMKKIVLKVVKQCCATDGVEAQYIKEEILPHFFKHFWNHRMALDRRNYRQLVDTTVEIANKVGASEIVNRVVDDLKDENEQYRKMVMETIEKIMANLGAADIDSRLEEQLIDGILYAFQEQTTEDVVMLNGFGTIVNQLSKRVKPYLPQICGTILWRLNNKSAKVRQQAADLISRIAVVMKTCQEEKLMGHLGVVLYEYLGEEYPEVLGSILGALKAIVNVIGMTKMTPPIKDLLPRLTPILKNRHEKVQENCIDLVGRIADRGPEYVSAREWMRICFELLELLKAHKKAIRRATVNTFGYIAKAIGPHDVLATLLNNLKVQERQNRVCTTVAIAIVAETCRPFTVLPALMNEYRVPELNVQNGVLKSLSFLFEYIGEMGKDYIYAVCPLLEDALMDRDLVHRQTACAAIKHMALGVYGFGCEDALIHLLNYVWPNIFETSPHLVQAFMDAVEGLRVALGPIKILQYTLQGLFHPARKVRDVYWKIYNSLYIGAQDALIVGYPRITNDPKNQYIRYELEYNL
ncbi:LOW QUALITY PROTEIN: splicing factor 3B subunit 1-like [Anopheles arabiensis]|uniref:Splicing factor 3B subunit 1 n=6 Tax=gambiae species complex TaxID=44542 RepID=Q7QEW2_ANOGA|nr:LOW QUALITY PROTEIN: splicing factor 3B subunit 1-like [Anopheles arabiensis]XP_040219203.2 splicing factor 3B subunit 1-like isoform X1 [Anopheles coluzzii]XP_040227423.2 splicing factor 3B subunit 1-like isoform X1 [Anopheles coluzzii]XP_041769723.1 splicing factor 3B subunit 1-like isoform X1 [Anopheles merus]EAA06480.5 AGAP000178-PA [Anopheles gambiae str. PEST]